jgi:hypothetical protein
METGVIADEAQYDQIGASGKPMYGPRGMVVSGMTAEEQEAVCALVRAGGMEQLPIIFVTDELMEKTLKEVLNLQNHHGKGQPPSTRRTIIMSGFLELERICPGPCGLPSRRSPRTGRLPGC